MAKGRRLGPAPDELEVSLFGPGKGEAIAVHLGDGDWITVDSCIERKTNVHPVLEYFKEIGVDPAHQVRVVVGTHAHDDHIAGMGRLYEACEDAIFVSSAALTASEFFMDVVADQKIEDEIGQSVRSEYRQVMETVRNRGLRQGLGRWWQASEARVLYERGQSSGAPPAKVVALSPSDHATQRARHALAQGLAREDARRRLSARDPNELAVAAWVHVGNIALLLGADLTNGPGGCGWKAVVAGFRPDMQADLYKVAHHGSPNAHHVPAWDLLLDPSVISMVAPFRAGPTPRPSPDDVTRLAQASSAVYASAPTKSPPQRRAVKRTEQALQGIARSVRDPDGFCGHVRARRRVSEDQWRVDLVKPALQVG